MNFIKIIRKTALVLAACLPAIAIAQSGNANNNGNSNNNVNSQTNGNANNNGSEKVDVCHYPPGNPGNAHTISISVNAWDAHFANHPYDMPGACPVNNNNNSNSNANNNNSNNVTFITICHRPNGNPSNGQTLTIPEHAWAAHRANHPYDELGPCVNNNNTNSNNNACNNNSNHNGNGNNNSNANANNNSNHNGNANNNNNGNPRAPKKVTVCHHPSGNPDNMVEISIPESAWEAHSANHPHDELGPCNSNNNNSSKRSGISETDESAIALEIFPNPAYGLFQVRMNVESSMSLRVRVFTAAGQLIFEDSKNAFSGNYLQEVSLSGYATGIYFVAVEMDGKTTVERILNNAR